ncbi:type II toxin-antitoxin system death-on-curing family toxin [Streptacidiphilus fuscans]|uniref:Type II toxin-antitoxin system death-on-curing family toxin n=1 Tax=Streptacidiphilus fuscans TaxID=2789292 RepID=A0A931B7C8_9ACTN|nr:type II toxin-antitoxin system death-on-curing family toxin [Streptacidiphilus fuscans]MBF9072464.1 type II toxin-antitoxin system death-on-curing family toxin [Streptacidiphilus fuscans]
MKYLTVQEALDLSELACGGRRMGLRDLGLLESAMSRPGSQMYGVEAYPGLFEKAAALLQSLAINHPFVDGNKRTAWLCTVVFLDLNGAEMLEIEQDEAFKLVVDVASGAADDVADIARRLRELHETQPPRR